MKLGAFSTAVPSICKASVVLGSLLSFALKTADPGPQGTP